MDWIILRELIWIPVIIYWLYRKIKYEWYTPKYKVDDYAAFNKSLSYLDTPELRRKYIRNMAIKQAEENREK